MHDLLAKRMSYGQMQGNRSEWKRLYREIRLGNRLSKRSCFHFSTHTVLMCRHMLATSWWPSIPFEISPSTPQRYDTSSSAVLSIFRVSSPRMFCHDFVPHFLHLVFTSTGAQCVSESSTCAGAAAHLRNRRRGLSQPLLIQEGPVLRGEV